MVLLRMKTETCFAGLGTFSILLQFGSLRDLPNTDDCFQILFKD